jgi:hypothetical protein
MATQVTSQDPAVEIVDTVSESDLDRALSQGPMQPRNVDKAWLTTPHGWSLSGARG